jgi:uncharacterized protein YecE (DUF72 family)
MTPGGAYIGTSGWSYPHWAKGRFYPRGLKPGDWLGFLAGHFRTVEVNSSFYRLPRGELLARWRRVVGPRFRFAVKLWRRITHDKRLANCDVELEQFFAVVRELGTRRGPLLVQLPPSQRRDVPLLASFLTCLFRAAGRRRWQVAIEFRNREWLCDEVYAVLDRYGVAVCLADLPRCPITEPNDVPFVYVRRHGPQGAYRGCYSAEQIAADAACVGGWVAAGKDVYVYYNNDVDGHAVDNARQLVAAVGAAAVPQESS